MNLIVDVLVSKCWSKACRWKYAEDSGGYRIRQGQIWNRAIRGQTEGWKLPWIPLFKLWGLELVIRFTTQKGLHAIFMLLLGCFPKQWVRNNWLPLSQSVCRCLNCDETGLKHTEVYVLNHAEKSESVGIFEKQKSHWSHKCSRKPQREQWVALRDPRLCLDISPQTQGLLSVPWSPWSTEVYLIHLEASNTHNADTQEIVTEPRK